MRWERNYVQNYVFFQCPGMYGPLDSAKPARPPKVHFFAWEMNVFMYLCTGFRQNILARYTSGYIVGTYIISD